MDNCQGSSYTIRCETVNDGCYEGNKITNPQPSNDGTPVPRPKIYCGENEITGAASFYYKGSTGITVQANGWNNTGGSEIFNSPGDRAISMLGNITCNGTPPPVPADTVECGFVTIKAPGSCAPPSSSSSEVVVPPEEGTCEYETKKPCGDISKSEVETDISVIEGNCNLYSSKCFFFTEFSSQNPVKGKINGQSCSTNASCSAIEKMDGGYYVILGTTCNETFSGKNELGGLSEACR